MSDQKIIEDTIKELENIGSDLAEELKETTEKEEEQESPEEETDKESEETDSEEDEESDDHPKKYVPVKKFKKFKERSREEKAEYERQISELKSALEEKQGAETEEEVVEAEEAIASVAKELNLDETALKRISDAIITDAQRKLGIDPETLKAAQESQRAQEEVKYFNSEWENIEPGLMKEYGNVEPKQLEKAKAKMYEISHTKEFHDKDLDYVLFKNRETFKEMLYSPKKKSLESGSLRDEVDVEEFNPDADFSKMNAKQIEKYWASLENASLSEKTSSKVKVYRGGNEIEM